MLVPNGTHPYLLSHLIVIHTQSTIY